MLMHLYMLYVNSRSLEEGHFVNRRADYVFFVLLTMLLLDVITVYMELPIMTDAFGMAVTYLYSMSRAEDMVTFMFGMTFKAMYLPWVLLVFNMAMGGSPLMLLIGIAVGHMYYFLDVVYPSQNGGRKVLVTPTIIQNLVGPEANVQGLSGAIPNAGNTARTAGASFGGPISNDNVRQRTSWGKGYKLGSE